VQEMRGTHIHTNRRNNLVFIKQAPGCNKYFAQAQNGLKRVNVNKSQPEEYLF